MILEEYAAFLSDRGISYSSKDGFCVRFDLPHGDYTYISVRSTPGGTMAIWDSFGSCDAGIRTANRIAKALQQHFPDYRIWVEKYSAFEIDVEQVFRFSSVSALHRRVERLAQVLAEGIPIAYEVSGNRFVR